MEAYQAELEEKAAILQELLDNYNDGRRKTFYMLAVYLLELQDLRNAMEQIVRETSGGGKQETAKETVQEITLKEKAAAAVGCFQARARRGAVMRCLRNGLLLNCSEAIREL